MRLKELMRQLAAQQTEEVFDLEAYLEQFIPQVLLKNETLQLSFEVSNEEMEELYAQAYFYYEENRLLEASTAFRWLVLLNPFLAKYWMGLGASLQLLEKYEKALHAYALSALLDCENPYPHYHAYECYKGLNDLEEGEKALELAYVRALVKTEYRDLEEEIVRIKKQENVCL